MRTIAGALLAAACMARSTYGAATEPAVEPLKLPERPRVIVFAPHPDDETIAAAPYTAHVTHAAASIAPAIVLTAFPPVSHAANV